MPVKSGDDLKSLMRRFVDEFQSTGDEAVADELLADIFRNHTAPPGMSPDKQGVKAYFAAFRARSRTYMPRCTTCSPTATRW